MMVEMGKAYIERLVLEQFVAGVKSADKSIQQPLVMLERLYALSMIEEYKGWYLENGYIEGRKAVYISKMVDELCLNCLLYTSPSPRDQRGSRMPSSA